MFAVKKLRLSSKKGFMYKQKDLLGNRPRLDLAKENNKGELPLTDAVRSGGGWSSTVTR